MAAAKKHSRSRGRKDHKNSFFCFFGGCFGISNKVSADHGDGKSVKNVSGNSGRRRRNPPVNDHKIPLSSSSEIVSSSREIHVVEDEEKTRLSLAAPADELISVHKTDDKTPEKSKNKEESSQATNPLIKRVCKQNSIPQETWTNPTKLSQSVSLPLPCQRREKRRAAGGDEKSKKGRVAGAGEFDSVVGAVIVMVTLLVMLIWGKMCAILCTAAWFYFIPRFRAYMDEYYATKLQNGENGQNHVDLDSREYKKKVVLQGLLDRNQHL